MGARLSTIVPVHNGEQYVKHCIESIQNQSLKDIQIIVVDDGSTDHTAKIVQEYSEVQLVHRAENGGTGAARNLGLDCAQGEYVAFLDVDDWLDSNAYLEMTAALDKSNSDIGICNIYTEYGDYRRSEIRYLYPHSNTITGHFALRLLCKVEAYDNYISPRVGNKIFRSDFLKKHSIRFPEYPIWEDDMFTFLAFRHSKKVDIISGVAEHYLQRESSAMHSFSRSHIDYLMAVLRQLRQLMYSEKNEFQYEEEYYAFVDRCLTTVLDSIFSNEQSVIAQRAYISYLINQLLSVFTIQELVDHMDPKRLARLWL